ncbi:MAG TPA: hypothetical protein VHB72_03970 [Candidatus Saccharimonadales bacterium]|nr:hypothetical protein [Candidatus Saccharimonadales bacterium]
MKRWEKIMAFVIVPILGIVVWTAAYAERGWIRGSLIPAYASFANKDTVNTTYDEVFYPVNTKLASYGFAKDQSFGVGCASGGNVMYEGFHERVPCQRMESLKFPGYSKSFEQRWQHGEAFAFDRFMKSQGWANISPNQPLLQMYAPRSDDKSLDIQYAIKRHGVVCNLMLIYYSWENSSDKTWANETCQKDLTLFGASYY